ncbi:MAG TPA: permease [Telluria sp.]|nr:permease [Telluria sp.]
MSLGDTPSLSTPLRFLLAAPWFALAAGMLLAWHGDDALATRWSPVTVALTHLVTLGFLAMTMAGALLQMLPVVAGTGVPAGALVARVAWPALSGGTLLLVAALLYGAPGLFSVAAALLAIAFALLAGAFGLALVRRAPRGALAMVVGMRFAVAALAITATLGVMLALFLGGRISVPALALTDIHAGWGLLGWVLVLVAGVAYQVIPMFQATPDYPKQFAFAWPALLAGALAAWSGATLAAAPWSRVAGSAVALLVLGFAGVTLFLLARRKRPAPDATTLYWRLSMGSLAACAVLYLWPGMLPQWRELLLAVLFIAGFAMGAVNGMLYKIVPFLLWYHLQQQGVPKAKLPSTQQWIVDGKAKSQFWLHATATALLCAAVVAPTPLARTAGLALCAACARLAFDLWGTALRYRRIARESALEPA